MNIITRYSPLLLTLFCTASIFSMEIEPSEENRIFLESALAKTKQKAELLQRLATGLIIQERLFAKIEKLKEDKIKIDQANDNARIINNLLKNNLGAEEHEIEISYNSKEFNLLSFDLLPKTPEGLKAFLVHRSYLRVPEYRTNHDQRGARAAIAALKNNNENSEPYIYGLHIESKLAICTAVYQNKKNFAEVELFRKGISAEHKNTLVKLAEIYLNYPPDNPLRQKLEILLKNLCTGSDQIDDLNQYELVRESCYDLYGQTIQKLKQITSPNKKLLKFQKTLEEHSTSFPPSLENPYVDELPVAKPNQHPKVKQKPQKSTKKSTISNQQLKSTPTLATPAQMTQNNEVQAPIAHETAPEVAQEPHITYAIDGSFTEPIETHNNEYVIRHPKTGTVCRLYAMDVGQFPVNMNLAALDATNNIRQWTGNPQQALEAQGYTTFGHKNFTQPENHGRMIAIHDLPEEIKRYAATHAQQTLVQSRVHNGQDIQVTFCGELSFADGSRETGLFIYLIDSRTKKIFHQLFTTQSYGKLFESFYTNGNFKDVFFPSLEWAYNNGSNLQ